MLTVKTFTFNPVQENTYILYNDSGDCCIIDPGCYFPAEREKLREAIDNAGLKPVLLLNTHCHLDHIFGNKFVFETWGLVPHIHRNEQQILENAPLAAQMWQLPFDNYEGELVYLEPGAEIGLGGHPMRILFTPGHSPGSVSFYYEPGGFVIAGDVLFNRSIGRTDLPGGNFEVLIDSIRTQLFPLPDNTIVYAGHGETTTVGEEREGNPFLIIR